jgi:hypothetical protein
MSSPALKDFVGEFLSFLERQEQGLLGWGFYDGSFSVAEIETLFEDAPNDLRDQFGALTSTGGTMIDIVDDMANDGLLYRLPGEERYRTRFAETVRLLARLRQRFQWQKHWSDGRTLVSDIRIHLRPRRFPKWGEKPEDCWTDLEPYCSDSVRSLLRASLLALSASGDGKTYTFAGFQRRAFAYIFRRYDGVSASGSVISAGTGAGKTKAFYIPAFLRIVEEISRRQPDFTKIVAIYPRNVLLADQFREAVSEAMKLRTVVSQFKLSRGITFGALLGDTPREADFENSSPYFTWKKHSAGFIVPYLKHPSRANVDLVWRDKDRRFGSTALYAADRPEELAVPDGVLRITREQLQASPPDVLFLSAEMLNREMGNPSWARTFGIRQGSRSPRMLLLDEVHSYAGIKGAQIAWLIRRWRYWTGAKRLHVVGLSATLRHAPNHLAEVAGLNPADVLEFRPEDKELTEEGIEYNLAVKGDPFSGASLLATTIQTGMLLTRVLTPKSVRDAGEYDLHGNAFYGRKVFGFTDNLDTLNRWFYDMRDAEDKHLASLRRERRDLPATELVSADEAGQIWRLPERLRHNLRQTLLVTGCSSQRPGLNAGSDLIVATSSLEVGFDDPEVGAMLHHKRPVSLSSFVQRKGRAGRRRGMRPFTVLVLSDFGGDRYAFRNAERFFEPDIDFIFLPIENPFVLRLQATYFLIEWIGQKVGHGAPFTYLRPGKNGSRKAAEREPPLEILRGLLRRTPTWDTFWTDFRRVFGAPRAGGVRLTEAQLHDILWNEPRPLLRQVVPTLIRKLERDWKVYNADGKEEIEDARVNRPIPALIPNATFGNVDVADIELRFPSVQGKEPESLAVRQALSETCPGRVSKRYSIGDSEGAYWSQSSALLMAAGDNVALDLRACYGEALAIDTLDGFELYQPMAVDMAPRPKEVLDSSNSIWRWRTHCSAKGASNRLPIPRNGVWGEAILNCEAYLHRNRASIEIVRYAHEADFVIRRNGKPKIRGVLRCVGKDDAAANQAVGFKQVVDGIRICISRKHLDELPALSNEEVESLRTDYFRHLVMKCPTLRERYEDFVLSGLATTSLAMLSATAMAHSIGLADAQALLQDRPGACRRVYQAMMPSNEQEGADEQRNTPNEVRDAWAEENTRTEMLEFERVLWQDPGPDFDVWARRRYVAALSQAFRLAAVAKAPDVSEEDLSVDVIDKQSEDVEIYISETASGGLGQIERVAAAWRSFPELIPRGILHALSFCPRQRTLSGLRSTLAHLRVAEVGDPVRSAVEAIRGASGFLALRQGSEELQRALSNTGLDSSRTTFVPIVSRLLAPGSSPETDELISDLNLRMRAEMDRLKIRIDTRTLAYNAVRDPALRGRIERVLLQISGGTNPEDWQVYRTAEQMLWEEDCVHACRECLDDYNWFNDAETPSRALASNWFPIKPREVAFDTSPDWRRRVLEILSRERIVTVSALRETAPAMMAQIQFLLAQEVESDYLLVPVSIAAVERRGSAWCLTLELGGVLS